MNDDAKRLVQLRQYEVDNYKNIKITEKKGKYIGHFPKDLIPKEDADMESAIKKWRLTHLIIINCPFCYFIVHPGCLIIFAGSIIKSSQKFTDLLIDSLILFRQI